MKKQLAFILARQCLNIELTDDSLNDIILNNKLSEYFLALAKDLEVVEPKAPEDIYKSHLIETRIYQFTSSMSLFDSKIFNRLLFQYFEERGSRDSRYLFC